MAYFKTNDFISKVRKDDLARSNRFEVVINSPANFLTDREVSLQVVKNTLLKKAFETNDTDFSKLYDVLVGNSSIMQAEDPSTAAKVIK